jgi:hypothetical protein
MRGQTVQSTAIIPFCPINGHNWTENSSSVFYGQTPRAVYAAYFLSIGILTMSH